MLKIFGGVRKERTKNLLNVLGFITKAMKPVSITAIKKETGLAYSCVHKNVKFLCRKGFLASEIHREGRKRRLCDITIKGALASLFFTHETLSINWPEVLEHLQSRDWGEDLRQPFRHISDVSELKRFVETLYLYGGSLEEVNEQLLKRALRNPEQTLSIILDATITFEKRITEDGKYTITIPYVPEAVSTIQLKKQDGINTASFVVMPDVPTGEALFTLLSRDPDQKKRVEASLLVTLQAAARDVDETREGLTAIYNPEVETLILTATIPGEVINLLRRPKQIMELMKKYYQTLLKAFLQEDESRQAFLEGKKSWIIFAGVRYSPEDGGLHLLSTEETRMEARKILLAEETYKKR